MLTTTTSTVSPGRSCQHPGSLSTGRQQQQQWRTEGCCSGHQQSFALLKSTIVLIILSTAKTYSADVNSTTSTAVNLTAAAANTTALPTVHTNLVSPPPLVAGNLSSPTTTDQWTVRGDNVTVTSQVANLSMSTTSSASTASPAITTTASTSTPPNPIQIDASSWSINKGTVTTAAHQHHNHSDLISQLQCEYGTIRKYSFTSVVQSRLAAVNGSTRATLLVRCLHQVTWGTVEQLNGQKYLAYISDFHADALEAGSGRQRRSKRSQSTVQERSKRSIYQVFEHLWSDLKSVLPFDEEENTEVGHDDYDQDLLRSMEGELRSKCHSLLFWEEAPIQSNSLLKPSERCLHCTTASNSNNPLSKFALPFWFIQLEDGTIPQIRFTKQDLNTDVKNFKKLIISLLATQLNSSNWNQKQRQPVETSTLGVHRSHYRLVKDNLNISTTEHQTADKIIIERHIETDDFVINTEEQQNKELPLLSSSDRFPLNITANCRQQIDVAGRQIISSTGQVTTTFGPSDLSLYSTTVNEHRLEREESTSRKMADLLTELQERYVENQKETLVAEPVKEDTLLQEKYSDQLYRLRVKLGRNEYHFYNRLFDCATLKTPPADYDALLRLVTLEQQLNHSLYYQHTSLIGDLRRIGTVHNIQLVCGTPNLARLVDSEPCSAFLYLLLQSSSKTAQHLLLYSLQNVVGQPSGKAALAARLLGQTYRPSRWLIENLAHETHHQSVNRPMETILLQTLTQIAQREQLVKLKELISVHLVKRIREALAEEPKISGSTTTNNRELYTIELLEMLGNLGNYSALQSVQGVLSTTQWAAGSDLIALATVHAYRRSINRSQVQNQLSNLFASARTCQIKQHIVQVLIDDVDRLFWLPSGQRDKRWPKYGFERLDQLLAEELRNGTTACVHHLVLDYFKRKVNSKARKLVAEFEAVQHNTSEDSFDFCITEPANYKCDYVQSLGNELARVQMRKSIVLSKAEEGRQKQAASSYIISGHSLSALIYRYQLTVAHLTVIQSRPSSSSPEPSRLQVQLQTPTGDVIPLANVPLDESHFKSATANSSSTNCSTVKIAQMKLIVPVKVAATEHSPQADNSLLVNMEAFFAVYLEEREEEDVEGAAVDEAAPAPAPSGSRRLKRPTEVMLRIQISLHATAEFAYSGLALQRSIELQTSFEYESKQPVEMWMRPTTQRNVSTTGQTEALLLGHEHFAGQVQLWHQSNKHYDAQCNIWLDQSARQQLSHWNSTVKQSNLLLLPLQPLPSREHDHWSTTTTVKPSEQSTTRNVTET